ncbi:MAG: hypothetical protein ASARMPRED_003004 [Alectoria sarmentosa]|nr:MAG: hypothetical protein ASARMPRED_003004 [Alectoria sarmentosa]
MYKLCDELSSTALLLPEKFQGMADQGLTPEKHEIDCKDPRKPGHHGSPGEARKRIKRRFTATLATLRKKLREHLSRNRHDTYDKRRLEEDIAFPDPSSDDDDEDNVSASAQDFGAHDPDDDKVNLSMDDGDNSDPSSAKPPIDSASCLIVFSMASGAS